jgi:hypothetical protein
MAFHKLVYPRAGGRGRIAVGQKVAYLGKVHAMLAATPYEVQALHIFVRVKSVACRRAFGLAQEAFLLVKAYGDHLRAGGLGEFSYF